MVHLRITNAFAKPEWLARLDGFLHDAGFRDRFAYDAQAAKFTLNLSRIGYDHARRAFGVFIRYPTVPCSLILTPVQIASVEEKEGAWDFDDLVDISLRGPSHVEFATREAKVVLYATQPVTLTLEDVGPPDARHSVTDMFFSICPRSVVEKLVGTAEA